MPGGQTSPTGNGGGSSQGGAFSANQAGPDQGLQLAPETKGGNTPPDGRKVKGTIHWVSVEHAVEAEVHLFEPLFSDPDPASADGDAFAQLLRRDSQRTVRAKCEPSLGEARSGDTFQFERVGYFHCDPKRSQPAAPVFHRTVTLKDAWKKQQKKKA